MTAEVRRPLSEGTVRKQDDEGTDPSSERQQDQLRLSDFLRDGRRQQALSLADVARVTRIPQESLRRLERGHFKELPADVYVRGFVSAFARAVGLDENEALCLHRACVQSSSPARTTASQAGCEREAAESVDRPEAPRQGVITLVVVVLLITCSLALTYLLRRPGSSSDGVTQPRIEQPRRWVA